VDSGIIEPVIVPDPFDPVPRVIVIIGIVDGVFPPPNLSFMYIALVDCNVSLNRKMAYAYMVLAAAGTLNEMVIDSAATVPGVVLNVYVPVPPVPETKAVIYVPAAMLVPTTCMPTQILVPPLVTLFTVNWLVAVCAFTTTEAL
jgi:hypothetical protein